MSHLHHVKFWMDSFPIWHKLSLAWEAWEGVSYAVSFDLDLYLQGCLAVTADFIEYTHMWHKYNPWGHVMSHANSMSHTKFQFCWSVWGYPNRLLICNFQFISKLIMVFVNLFWPRFRQRKPADANWGNITTLSVLLYNGLVDRMYFCSTLTMNDYIKFSMLASNLVDHIYYYIIKYMYYWQLYHTGGPNYNLLVVMLPMTPQGRCFIEFHHSFQCSVENMSRWTKSETEFIVMNDAPEGNY